MTHSHEMQSQRFELKYLVPRPAVSAIRNYLSSRLVLDPYGSGQPSGAYPVHSIYLDSADLKTHHATQNGDKNRFKLRLRYYDAAPASPVFCELKRRVDNCVLKQRCAVARGDVARVLSGQAVSVAAKHRGALNEFLELMLRHQARPRAHNAYRREAWVSRESNSVRVTFDTEVCIEPFFELAAPVTFTRARAVYAEVTILEIKFVDRYPNWLREMVTCRSLRQLAAAKYSGGVQLLGEHQFTTRAQYATLNASELAEPSASGWRAAWFTRTGELGDY